MNIVCPRCGVALGVVEPLDRETVVHRPCQACAPTLAGRTSRTIYVDPHQPALYRDLVEEYKNDPGVRVLFDRRSADRRRRPDRRAAKRQITADRRVGVERRLRQMGLVVHGRPAN